MAFQPIVLMKRPFLILWKTTTTMLRTIAFLSIVFCAAVVQGALTQYWSFDTDLANSVDGGLQATAVGSGVSVDTSPGQFVRGTGALKISHNTAGGDYLNVAGAVLPEYNPSAFSVATWFKFDDSLGSQTTDARNFLFETTPNWSFGAGLRDDAGARKLECYSAGSDVNVFSATGIATNDGQWHHLTMVHNAAGQDAVLSRRFDGLFRCPQHARPAGEWHEYRQPSRR